MTFSPKKIVLFLILGLVSPSVFALRAKKVSPHQDKKVWAHVMPWFETRDTSEDGEWGMHWAMAKMNPDNIDGTGRREIAAHYYPLDDVYGSGDPAVVERQLAYMKYAGIDGVLIDWPGTLEVWDYPKNKANAEAMINAVQRFDLEFAIVYEDHNIGMAADAGFITDKIGAAQNDMIYMQNNYFNHPNHIIMPDGKPLLLDFGPQTFRSPQEWEEIFSVLNPRPSFFTLWEQMNEAAGNSAGEYAWLYVSFMLGLSNFYLYNPSPQKIGVVYPGFHTAYELGGWPGPTWQIPHNGLESFQMTLDLALNHSTMIQLATWNDYGEGTQVEPTREFGTGCIDVLQQTLLPQYDHQVFETIADLYKKRVKYAGSGLTGVQSVLDQVSDYLVNLEPEKAAEILATVPS